MKTLILNGSPRANGDTASLVKKLVNTLEGDSWTVITFMMLCTVTIRMKDPPFKTKKSFVE